MLTVGDGGDGGFSHSRRCRVKCSDCVLTVGDGGDGGFSHSRRCRVKCSVCLPLVMVVMVVSPTPDVAELSVLCAYRW